MNCKHFPQCGGCQFLDLEAEEEIALKSENFLNALARQGIKAEIKEFDISPLHSRRRASLSGKRTKKSSQIGFSEAKTHHIIDMTECLILEPSILALKPALQAMMPLIASRSAIVKFHITALAHGFDLVIENSKTLDAKAIEAMAKIANDAQIHRITIENETIFQDAPTHVQMGEYLIEIPPLCFLQATKQGENKLRKLAHDAVSDAKNIADLFAGIGTFSYGLECQITAFETHDAMTQAMQNNLNRLGLHNIKTKRRDLFREPLNPSELQKFDAIIIDPPRAGAKAQCQELARSDVERIAFIACDAESFARDARILINEGYQMDAVSLIDQFRFSNHIESFTVFKKLY